MSEELTGPISPEAAALHLGVDYSTFVLVWLPTYRKHLSASAQSTDYPILSSADLALLEQVLAFRKAGHSHKVIRRTLRDFYRPEAQPALRVLIGAVEKRQKAVRP